MTENYNQRWPVIQDILRREGIARQHLTSFDEFLDNGLQSHTNTPGSGCSFHANGITQGRITNIEIDNSGSGYLSDNLPFVVVKKYKLNKNGK